jgi:hypothetical protein
MNCPVIATRMNHGERRRTGFEPMACKGPGVRVPVPPQICALFHKAFGQPPMKGCRPVTSALRLECHHDNQEVNRWTNQDLPPSCVTIISEVLDGDSAMPIPSVVFMKCK